MLIPAVVLALLALGCDSPSEPEGSREVGIVQGVNPDDPHFDIPAEVEAGKPFTVTVRTYALSGCVSKAKTDADVQGPQAVVIPYNLERTSGGCTDEVRIIEHSASLRFDTAGPAVVVIFGRDRRAPPQRANAYPFGLVVR